MYVAVKKQCVTPAVKLIHTLYSPLKSFFLENLGVCVSGTSTTKNNEFDKK